MELKNEKRFHENTKSKLNQSQDVQSQYSFDGQLSIENENTIEVSSNLSIEEVQALQSLSRKLRNEWLKEKNRNVLLESIELKEKQFFYEELMKSGG